MRRVSAKRCFDVLLSLTGLLVLAPLFAVLSVAVRLDSPGPAIFRQQRVGRHGRPFAILKFRTMRAGAGPLVTAGDDPRITRVGALLRQSKLDELPQLWNILRGDMSLVGPRPEVPRYVAHYPPGIRERVLGVRPGLTDPAAVRFRNEADILAGAEDPERDYLEQILPAKLAAYVAYVDGRSFRGDLRVLADTLRAVLGWVPGEPGHGSGTPPPGTGPPG